MELETHAISTVHKYLARGDYPHGERVLRDVLQRWAKRYSFGRYSGSPTFEFRSLRSQQPELEQPPIQDITRLVIYPHESRYENILRGLSREWIYRAMIYYDDKHEEIATTVEGRGVGTALTPWEFLGAFWPERAVFRILSVQPLQDGLDFLAMVLVQWAFRFDSMGFLEWMRGLGWPVLANMPREEFITQCAILFPAMAFQMEDILPIYWALIDARERRKGEVSI